MKELRWTLWVHDERGRRHRGVVSYGEDVPAVPPEPPAEFRIALLAAPQTIDVAPNGTAICVPRLAKPGAVVGGLDMPLSVAAEIAALKQGVLPASHHAQYQAGRIVLPGGEIDARKVFTHEPNVELEPLALILIDLAHAEAIAPYTAVIRHELGLDSGGNALLALEARLQPADPGERPPARAPGVTRLRAALRRLKAGTLPAITLESLTEDLRFLRMFEREEHVLQRDALDRLLSDVTGAPTTPAPRRPPARITRLHPREDA